MTNRTSCRLRPLIPFGVIGLLGFLAACNVVPPAQDDPTQYFVLSDPAAPAAQASATGSLRIGLNEVRLESYLDRKDMVVRLGGNEVLFRDFRRWAEPLGSAIARVVRLRLLEAPGVGEVYTMPFPADRDRDYDVTIEVRRCEGLMDAPGKYVASLSATIVVSTAGPSPHVVARRNFTAPEAAWDGRDFDRLAALLSADVSALGQEVLGAIPAKE
jgi:uncharacterized lipoprotein YmbA